MNSINIKEKLALFHETWTPKIVAELNGQQVKLAKLKGEFIWHSHTHEDELFYILDGVLIMEFRDKTITLNKGDMLVIPAGVEHKPIANEEVHVMLFEPAETKHTGDIEHELTVNSYEYI
jgi:mannose-6-phosphate isomerase-like protein (cupin superfamily)